MRFFILTFLLVVCLVSVLHAPKFKIGDCITDDRTELIRKITDVRTVSYEYCIYKNKKCVGKRFIRTVFFDRIMYKTLCIKKGEYMRTVIAFCGVKQSGKTTAFNALKDNFKEIIEVTIAKKLKDTCSTVFNIERHIFEDQRFKEVEIDPPIFLNESRILEVVNAYGIKFDFDKHIRPHIGHVAITPRKLLQYVGTDILKNIDTEVHCNSAIKHLPKDGIFAVTDLRFPDEHDYFTKYDCEFHPFYISRASAEVNALKDPHPSEQLVFETAKKCVTLDNNKNKIDFELLVVKTVKEIICRT